MGKRKHSKEDNYEYIARKLKKLEKRLNNSRKHRNDSISSTESASNRDAMASKEEETPATSALMFEDEVEGVTRPVQTTHDGITESLPSTSAGGEIPPDQNYNLDDDHITAEVSSEILELLGDDPSIKKSYGKDINANLAVRFQYNATTGLSKEQRKELQAKYLSPNNCTQIDAPLLNPEIKVAVNDIVLKRDKGIEIKQKVLGSAISCLGDAISILLDEENKNSRVIKLLMDASRLLCDCQNTDSMTRRNYILYNVKKDMKTQIQKTKIDNFLFGSDLAETLKTAKSISKSGADLKITSASKTQPTKTVSNTQKNLNWKAPPPSRRFRTGTQRMKEPAPKNQPMKSSRQSYRTPQSAQPAQRTRFRQ